MPKEPESIPGLSSETLPHILLCRRAPTHLNCLSDWLVKGPAPACVQCREPLPAAPHPRVEQVPAAVVAAQPQAVAAAPRNLSIFHDPIPWPLNPRGAAQLPLPRAAEAVAAAVAPHPRPAPVAGIAAQMAAANAPLRAVGNQPANPPNYTICLTVSCSNRAPANCVNSLCGRCCVSRRALGYFSCARHNVS